MNGFGIEIKNTLIEPKHIKKMGVSLWLYLWMVDKVTQINEEGEGLVLGGKPIKYEEDIEKQFGIHANTYTAWLDKLESGGYVRVIRTPNGLSFRVQKVHKRFGKRITKKGEADSQETVNRVTDNCESNIRHNRDITVDIAEPPAPPVFSFKEYLKKMQVDKRSSIRFIAYFFKLRNLTFDSEDQVKVAIKRHVRAATDVVKFGDVAVREAVSKCKEMGEKDNIAWTIETVLKMLTK